MYSLTPLNFRWTIPLSPSLEPVPPPLATGQKNKSNTVTDEECDYVDSHWLESEEYKLVIGPR
jgi:hypothetical protein